MMPGAQLLKKDAVSNTATLAQSKRLQIVAVRIIAPSLAANEGHLQMFDAAAATDVTLGTTKPDWVVVADGGGGSGEVSTGDGLPTHGLVFERGLVIAWTAGSENAIAVTGATTADVRIGVV
jgi:hypothetical protein